MIATQLQQQLNRLGAVRCGNTVTAPCPLCQPEPVPVEKHHLSINAGSSVPLVFFCHRCQTPKPQTQEERDRNRQISRQILEAAGCDSSLCFERMDAGEIRRIWSQVQLGAAVLEQTELRAPDFLLHSAYCYDLLRKLTLSDRHRRWLAKRGMDPDWCEEMDYRTAVADLPAGLQEGVPGAAEGRWLLRPDSLLIPCRNREGRILAVKQRITDGGKARMRVLSHRGIKAKQLVHWPKGAGNTQGSELWITEGERKADFVHWKLDVPICGMPGCGSWQKVLPFASQYKQVVLVLDRDEAGRKTTDLLGRCLRAQGVETLVGEWVEGKGIDDALHLNGTFDLRSFEPLPNERSEDAQPPTKGTQGLQWGQRLRDHQIVEYLRQYGPTPMHLLNCYTPTVLALLKEGRLRDRLTKEGRILEVVE